MRFRRCTSSVDAAVSQSLNLINNKISPKICKIYDYLSTSVDREYQQNEEQPSSRRDSHRFTMEARRY